MTPYHWLLSSLRGSSKRADLLEGVELQPHQQRVADETAQGPQRKLLVMGLGSGKSLASIAAAEAYGQPYTAVTPAALRPNFQKEIDRFTDHRTPSRVMSYSGLAAGKDLGDPGTLIFDESSRLKNPESKQTQAAMQAAQQAKQLLLLSGTPLVNRPSDLATSMSMLTGEPISPDDFEKRYVHNVKVWPSIWHRLFGVTPGVEEQPNRVAELKEKLRGHVDWYQPEKPAAPSQHEDHIVEMGPEQTNLYNGMWNKLSWITRWKLQNDFPLSPAELKRTTSFLTGPRQVGLSPLPYARSKDPLRAFQQSPKLQKAHGLLAEELKDPRTKALVFANFIDAGLKPYSAALQEAGVPHAIFDGSLNDRQRKQLVNDYNDGKIRVALIGPSGMEGLSFKGTQLIQLLDGAWNQARPNQAVGRGLRFDSHTDLPDELKHVRVQRFISRLPLGFTDRMMSGIGFDRSQNQLAADDHLMHLAAHKDKLNQKFMDLLKEVGTEGH